MSGVAAAILRLGPLVRLLGSNQPGEVSAAVGGLRRVLEANGLDLNDFAAWMERMASQDAVAHHGNWAEVARGYMQRGTRVLDQRDLDFLANVATAAARGTEPSEKQQKWLNDIGCKLTAAEARGACRTQRRSG